MTAGVGPVLEAPKTLLLYSEGNARSMEATGTLGLPPLVCAQVPWELPCSRLLRASQNRNRHFSKNWATNLTKLRQLIGNIKSTGHGRC